MRFIELYRKEREVWHDHFVPGVVAGVVLAVITAFFRLTGSNVALFASIGASAVILTHKYRHKLTVLRTVLLSYILSGLVSVGIAQLPSPVSVKVFLAIFLVTMLLYSVDVFHPPAVSASLAVILYNRPLIELLYVLLVTLAMFVTVRYIIYVYHEHLTPKEFFKEFV